MKLVFDLMARFGLVAKKSEGPDAFDLRLQRIGTRERRLRAHAALFRSLLQPLEGGVRS